MMGNYKQMDLFEATYPPYRIDKPIRLIELFAGIGAQHKALSVLGADFESYRVCEWSINSILAYNHIHIKDYADYSKPFSYEELLEKVRGVSADYNKPMTDKQLRLKGERWVRRLYSSMVAIKDLSPDISKLKGEDLGIEPERERARLCHDILVPLPGPVGGGENGRDVERRKHKVGAAMAG